MCAEGRGAAVKKPNGTCLWGKEMWERELSVVWGALVERCGCAETWGPGGAKTLFCGGTKVWKHGHPRVYARRRGRVEEWRSGGDKEQSHSTTKVWISKRTGT